MSNKELDDTIKKIKQNCENYINPKYVKKNHEKNNSYLIEVDYSGFVRGTKKYLVVASSEQEAKKIYNSDDLIEDDVLRDDTNINNVEIELVKGEDYE